jgi:hypothetical protein
MAETVFDPPVIKSAEEFLRYLISQVDRFAEIMQGGTPGEEDLVIGGVDRDSPLAQIYASIIGRANDVPPELLQDDARLNNLILNEIAAIGRAIQGAGGWEAWAEANGIDITEQPSSEPEPGEPSLLEQILANNPDITEEDVNVINSIIEATGRAIPTSTQDAKDLIESVWNAVSATSKDCETWTGRVVEGEGGSGSVPGSGSGTYQGWKDCVNIGAIFSIPGLNLPIPPTF